MKVALAGTESLTNYIAALKANDIEVINTLDVEEALKCDGLLLPGGGDMDPKYYGEEMNGSDEPDRELDKAQRDILDAFVKASLYSVFAEVCSLSMCTLEGVFIRT